MTSSQRVQLLALSQPAYEEELDKLAGEVVTTWAAEASNLSNPLERLRSLVVSAMDLVAGSCKPAPAAITEGLLPCLQCGLGDVYLIEDRSDQHEGGVGWCVQHIRLYGAVVPCHMNTGWWPTAKEARDCWNRRPAGAPGGPKPHDAMLAALIDRALNPSCGQAEAQHQLLELADRFTHTTERTAHYVILGSGDPSLVVSCCAGAYRSPNQQHRLVPAGEVCPSCGGVVVAGKFQTIPLPEMGLSSHP